MINGVHWFVLSHDQKYFMWFRVRFFFRFHSIKNSEKMILCMLMSLESTTYTIDKSDTWIKLVQMDCIRKRTNSVSIVSFSLSYFWMCCDHYFQPGVIQFAGAKKCEIIYLRWMERTLFAVLIWYTVYILYIMLFICSVHEMLSIINAVPLITITNTKRKQPLYFIEIY